MLAIKLTIIPNSNTFLRPIESDNLPENGRDNPAEMVNNPIIQPLYDAPFKSVIIAFISGMIQLKLNIKKNIERQINQKLRE